MSDMADIFHALPIRATPDRVFQAISTPKGLDTWWTKDCSGRPALGEVYDLGFGPEYAWQARVTQYTVDREFELELTRSDDDWNGTKVGFQLEDRGDRTWLAFHHTGWPQLNEHFRISCTCWASYLRILRRSLEHGEFVQYDDRLDV
jgi:uncharacterized protein YndB with AHSA1/START domain